jgi:hypothetical protein
MGYLLVVDTNFAVNKMALLPPGTNIVLAIADAYEPVPGVPVNSLSVTSDYGVHYIISNWITSTRANNSSWDGVTSEYASTNIFTVFGFIPPAYARRRLRIRRKLQRIQASERMEDKQPSVLLL